MAQHSEPLLSSDRLMHLGGLAVMFGGFIGLTAVGMQAPERLVLGCALVAVQIGALLLYGSPVIRRLERLERVHDGFTIVEDGDVTPIQRARR